MVTKWLSCIGQCSPFLAHSPGRGLSHGVRGADSPTGEGGSDSGGQRGLPREPDPMASSVNPPPPPPQTQKRDKNLCASRRFLSSAAFPQSRPANSLAFQGGLLEQQQFLISPVSRDEEGVRMYGEKSLSDHLHGNPARSHACLLPLLGLSSFLLLPSPAARCPPAPMAWKGVEWCTHLTYFSCIPERGSQSKSAVGKILLVLS